MNFGNHTSLLVVDTTPLVGNFFEAYLEVSKDTNVPMKYVPLFADDGHQEWFSGYFHQELTKRFLQDSLKIPGSSRHVGLGRACLGKEYSKELGVTWLRYFARLPSEPPLVFQFKEISIPWLRPFARLPSQPPAEHMESKPEPPALKRCLWGKASGSLLQLLLLCQVSHQLLSFVESVEQLRQVKIEIICCEC